jgi:hypothetical protein
MALFPGALLPWVQLQFCDDNGDPVFNGKLYSYTAGTTTPQDTFASSDLDPISVNANPIELDSNGRPPDPIYLSPTGYKFKLTATVDNVDDVELWTFDDVEDVGQTFASTFGNVQAEGGTDVVSGYDVLTTDRLVTVDSTGGANPCIINLLPAADATQLLTIKNMGTVALAITPDGTETIDSVNAAYAVAAASSPNFPSVMLVSNGVSAYFIIGSHGL